MSAAYMTCGHSASGVKPDGSPACVLCEMMGKSPTVAPPPDLTGRTAYCPYGQHAPKPSSVDLAFFEHRPEQVSDQYYCGCHGWD